MAIPDSILPLLYGYLRVDMAAGRADEFAGAMEVFAARNGFEWGTVFRDPDRAREGFEEMLNELRRTDTRYVLVPSLAHLAGGRLTALESEAVIHAETGAQVLLLDQHRTFHCAGIFSGEPDPGERAKEIVREELERKYD